jgi:hypothetical protein
MIVRLFDQSHLLELIKLQAKQYKNHFGFQYRHQKYGFKCNTNGFSECQINPTRYTSKNNSNRKGRI